MKKETLIAIVMGIIFGAGVALFLILKTKKADQPKVIPVATTNRVTPLVARSGKTVLPISISEPESNSVTDKKTTTIKGKATKGSLLLIQSPIKYVVKTLEKDDFSEEFPLALGENIIHISVYIKDSKAVAQEKTLIIYSLEEK